MRAEPNRGVDEAALIASAAAAEARHARDRSARILGWRGVLLLAALAAWSLASGRVADAQFVSSPGGVAARVAQLAVSPTFHRDVRTTLTEMGVGYAAGAAGGVAFAVLVGTLGLLQRALQPFLVAFYAIPKIALAPLFIMWFGLGMAPKMILAGLFVFFVVFMNTLEGMRQVSPDLLRVARVLGATRPQLLRKIVLPAVVPFLFVALRIAVPEAMIGAVIGEFIAANAGLGYFIGQASNQFNTTSLLAGVVALLAVVLALEGAAALGERRLLRWRPHIGGGAGV